MPRASIRPDTNHSSTATPATTSPAQTVGEKASRTAQLATSSTTATTRRRVPVSHAATGTSVQARARRPAATPRRRHEKKVTARPTRVRTRASAAQVVESMETSTFNGRGLAMHPA